ncbi:MAG: helix-hairpin-helix domain-containing protein [Thermoplasmata archaeon]
MRKVLLLLTIGLLALTGFAAATHLPDHRYHVNGSIVDSFGMPGMFVRVDVVDITDPLVPPSAGSAGFGGDYSVLLHLHNSNVGDQIRVTVAGQSAVITADFDPTDGASERFSPPVAFTIAPGANLVPYVLIALAIVIPLVVVARIYAPRGRHRVRRKRGLDSISGIGKAREKELRNLGIDNVDKLAAADATRIADNSSFTLKEAKRVVRRAGTLVEEGEPPT